MDTILIQPQDIQQAVKLLRAGELVSFPTETVYGLGADATNEEAVAKVYIAKGRPSDNPLIVHIAAIEDLKPFVDKVSVKAQKLMTTFWPGALTLIFEIKKGSLSPIVTGGLSTVAFRVPNNMVTLELLRQVGVPLVGPSSNTSGKPSPTTADHVYHDLVGKVAGILDDGPTELGIESTVIDMTSEIPVILRPGMVSQKAIEDVIGNVAVDKHLIQNDEAPKAPGMKYQHYSPDARVVMIDWQEEDWFEAIEWATEQGLTIGLLATQEIVEHYQNKVQSSFVLTKQNNVVEASQHLFSGLRYLDERQEPIAIIFAQTFAEEEIGVAYMNRLKKAANQEYFQKN